MALSTDDLTRQKLVEVQKSYFATNQTSLHELKALIGPFVDLIGEAINNKLPAAAIVSLQHAADDFRSMLYAMMICNGLEINNDDPMFTALTARGLMHTFFFDIRALFDYMLRATLDVFRSDINQASGVFSPTWLQRQLNRTNYTQFLGDLTANEALARNIFGDGLVSVWLACDWYGHFNDMRNGLAHSGHFLSVSPTNPDAFLVETLDGGFPLHALVPAKLIEQDNTIFFSLFSGMYAGLMIDFINKWSAAILQKANLPASSGAYGGRGASSCSENIHRAIARLQI